MALVQFPGPQSGAYQPDLEDDEDGATGKMIWKVAFNSAVAAVAFSPDGKNLAAADGKKIDVRSATTGQSVCQLAGHTGAVTCLTFSGDGKNLVSGAMDKTVRVWDLANTKELRTLTGHKGGVLGVAFKTDGKRIASAGADKTVRIWDSKSAKTPESKIEKPK